MDTFCPDLELYSPLPTDFTTKLACLGDLGAAILMGLNYSTRMFAPGSRLEEAASDGAHRRQGEAL